MMPIYLFHMTNETMKQVAVRMTPKMHQEVIRMAGRARQSFGAFVRASVTERVERLKGKAERKDATKC